MTKGKLDQRAAGEAATAAETQTANEGEPLNEHLAGDMLLRTGRPDANENPNTRNKVTVVVPARNEEAAIGPCLDSILAQDWDDLEVLVVDGASTDSTRDVVAERQRRDLRVRLVENERQIIPVALNLALAEATGRWLVRVDAHASIPAGYVRRAVEHLSTGLYGGVGGRKDGVGVTTAGRAIAAAMGSRFGVGGSTYHHGTTQRDDVEHVPFGAYPVALLRELGGWDERLRVNQDFELDFRLRQAGHRILFDPQMRIDWQSRQTVRELFWQYHRYGRGKVFVAWLHPSSLRPRHLAAPGLVFTLLGSGLVALRKPRLALTMLAPYVAALAAASNATARSVRADSRPHVAPAFLAMHVGWGLGFWHGVWQLLTSPSRRLPRVSPSRRVADVRSRESARTPGRRDQ